MVKTVLSKFRILFFVLFVVGITGQVAGQNFNYQRAWKKIGKENFVKKPKTCLALAREISAHAWQEKNDGQFVKATIAIEQFTSEMTEKGDSINIRLLDSEIAVAGQPLKSILLNLQADNYQSYYSNHSYDIDPRTPADKGIQPGNFYTWDAKKFESKIRTLALQSIAEKELLRQLPVRKFAAMLDSFTGSEKIRPTLYDLLTHNVIGYFSKVKDKLFYKAFDSLPVWGYRDFLAINFEKQRWCDPAGFYVQALQLYQDLEKWHGEKQDTAALIVLDMERLQFMRNHTESLTKETDYYNGLLKLEIDFNGNIYSADAGCEKAKMISDGYRPIKADTSKYLRQIALDICDWYIKKSGITLHYGWWNISSLRAAILDKFFDPSIDGSLLPGKPGTMKLRYRNINKIYYRIIVLNEKQYNKLSIINFNNNDAVKQYLKSKIFAKGSDDLLLPADYQYHNAALKLPVLEPGNYLVMVSDEEKFTLKNISYARLNVCGLKAVVRSILPDAKPRLYVMNAETGAPVAGAEVSINIKNYNGKQKYFAGLTNENGFLDIDTTIFSTTYETWDFVIIKGGDKLLINGASVNTDVDEKTAKEPKEMHFYTDRAIYRPGQTVFFKGILIGNGPKPGSRTVIPGEKINTWLKNYSGAKLDSLSLTTNAFGSVSGSFKIPAGGLNGYFEVGSELGRTSIQVEEYKRPKFEMHFLPVHRQWQLHDSVTIEGQAISYAGANLDGVEVTYKIKVEQYGNQHSQLARGKIKTDKDGIFSIRFKAEPYRVQNESQKKTGTYSYFVDASVSDINGETHSETQTIYASEKGLIAGIETPEWVNGSEEFIITPSVKNLNEENVQVRGILTLDKLAEPTEPYLPEPEKTDYDFSNEFTGPSDPETEDDLSGTIERKFLALPSVSNTEIKIDAIKLKELPQGLYRLRYTTRDSFGHTITATKKINIYHPALHSNAVNRMAYMIPVKTEYLQPGEKAQIIVGSALHAFFNIIAEHDGKIIMEKRIEVNKGQTILEIPIEEKYRGRIKIAVFTAVDNHFIMKETEITVPFATKDLVIKTSVFHSVLQPGQKETWKLNIKGPDAAKVSAELMATLYDASLDAIDPLLFDNLNQYPDINNRLTMNNINNESSVYFQGGPTDWLHSDWYFTHHFYDELKLNLETPRRLSRFLRRGSWKDVSYYQDGIYDITLSGATSASYYSTGYSSGYGIKIRNAYCIPSVANWSGSTLRLMLTTPDKAPPALRFEPLNRDVVLFNNLDTSKLGTYVVTYNQNKNPKIHSRKNLQELAFFFPQLTTNDSGNVEISFTIPETLTKWHFMALAHTKDLLNGFVSDYTITQKQIMVQPNAPRFLREGDAINFTAKITNMSNEAVDAEVHLELADERNDKIINNQFLVDKVLLTQKIHINARSSSPVSWALHIPKGLEGFIYRVTAGTANFSDGEEGMIPVLPARILVTESMPMFVRGNQTKTFDFKNITKYRSVAGLSSYRLSMEMTSNPAWYAVQALPYLMEFPHECNEQLFNRVFANTVAKYIVEKEPKIKEVFASWAKGDGKALESNLEKNQDVKNILLNETPWLLDAENESERKKRIGMLFDDSVVNKGLEDAISKLEKNQLPDGSFPWFPGMQGSRYITGIICSGIGRIEGMRIQTLFTDRLRAIGVKAFIYLDKMMKADYDALVKSKQPLNDDHLTSDIVTYLYARTFWKVPLENPFEKPLNFWLKQAASNWKHISLMDQAMLVSALKRQDEEPSARKIWNSIDDRALHSDEMGMYWKENSGGYGYHSGQVETQAMLIEAYNAMLHTNLEPIEEMKLWLLKQKQTHNWGTTIATADAVYCLLLRGTDPIASDKEVKITMGDQTFDTKTSSKEAGTGYFSHAWNESEIAPKLGEIKLEKKDDGIAWGAVHFQYYQDLDKIKTFSGPINIKKEVYLKENTNDGPVLKKINDKTPLKTGDLLTTRIIIHTDRDMEYIHLKDLRAGALEPVEQISGYRYSGGPGYYQEIKDASMNFFFDHIAPGTYVFEYNLRVTQTGTFQNGIATIENMYAPEFKSHSGSEKIEVRSEK